MEFHAENLSDAMVIPFEYSSYEVEGSLIKVNTEIYDEKVTVTVAVTFADTAESIEEKLIEELEDCAKEIESANRNYVNWHIEQGYGCTGIL